MFNICTLERPWFFEQLDDIAKFFTKGFYHSFTAQICDPCDFSYVTFFRMCVCVCCGHGIFLYPNYTYLSTVNLPAHCIRTLALLPFIVRLFVGRLSHLFYFFRVSCFFLLISFVYLRLGSSVAAQPCALSLHLWLHSKKHTITSRYSVCVCFKVQ